MPADRVVDVALCDPSFQPILVVSHVEEVLVRVGATRVPRVDRDLSNWFVYRFLNVPEDVLGQPFEGLLGRRHRHILAESAA